MGVEGGHQCVCNKVVVSKDASDWCLVQRAELLLSYMDAVHDLFT